MSWVDEILAAFPRHSALIVGDICLDRWCTYDPRESEPSRETGIPRLAVLSTEVTPGAGGTVANNLAALGIGRVAVLGAIGDDGFGYELQSALQLRGISPQLLVAHPAVSTFTYTKLLNSQTGDEDRPRVDFINTRPMPPNVEDDIVDRLRSAAPNFDVLFIADQAETAQGGVITPRVRAAVTEIARANPEKVVWVDSRLRASEFRNVIIKPNQDEAAAACARLFGKTDYQGLRRHVGSRLLLVTRGANGVIVVDENGEQAVPTRPIGKPVDICGAGDSFSAGAAIALAATRSPVAAARFGNLVASITIMKKGTGTASPAEVLSAAQ